MCTQNLQMSGLDQSRHPLEYLPKVVVFKKFLLPKLQMMRFIVVMLVEIHKWSAHYGGWQKMRSTFEEIWEQRRNSAWLGVSVIHSPENQVIAQVLWKSQKMTPICATMQSSKCTISEEKSSSKLRCSIETSSAMGDKLWHRSHISISSRHFFFFCEFQLSPEKAHRSTEK